MKNRIKEIRNHLNMTQSKFAEDMGVSKSNIESYELGRRSPSNAFVKLICSKYNVNESWLLTGEGEMLAPATKEQEIASIAAELMTEEEDSFKIRLVKLLSQMNPDQTKKLKEIIESLIK